MGGKKKTTVGYRYGMGLHFALCYGPLDRFRRIIAGKRTAWNGSRTVSGTITVSRPQLFGGDEREGGINGSGYVLMGESTQTLPTDIATEMGGIDVGFRGITSVYYNGLVSSNNPYLKPWEFRVRRIVNGWSIGGAETQAWYSEKAAIPLAGTLFGPQAICLCLDVSGSMGTSVGGGLTRLDVLKLAAVQVLNEVKEITRTGTGTTARQDRVDLRVVAWAATATSFTAYNATQDDIDDAITFINALTAGGGTNFNAAMTQAVAFFAQLNSINIVESQRSIYFVTDGLPEPIGTAATAAATAADLIARTGDYSEDAGTAVDMYGINIDLTDTQYTELLDNTPADEVPVITGSDTAALTNALRQNNAEGMNPAHIIYQCLVDDRLPLGFSTTLINDTNFREAADTFYDEGLGLCLIWNAQAGIGDFIRQVLEHCRALLYVDPIDGKFNLKPLRFDYDPDALTIYDEQTIIAYESFSGASADELTSTVQVLYRDVNTNEDGTITAQNLGILQQQFGAPVETVSLPGLPTAELAGRAAQAILDQKSLPLKKHRVRLTRAAADLKPGDVIKFSWAKLGISESIVRVIAVNRGNLRDGTVVVDAVDDVFGFPLTTYLATQPIEAEEFDPAPVPIVTQTVIEIPYWTAALYEGNAFADGVDIDSGYLSGLAARPSNNSQVFRIYSRIDPADFEDQDIGNFVPTASIVSTIDEQATTIDLENETDLDEVEVGDLVIIGEGRNAEWALITSVTVSPAKIEVSRGVLDTTPKAFTAGTPVWFSDGFASQDSTERATGQEVELKLATISTGGELDFNEATSLFGETEQRIARPYPPGNVAVNGEAWPVTITGALTITWAHRDRKQQTAYVVEQNEGDIGPEAGTTYNVYAYDVTTETLLDSDTGLTGTTWSPVLPDAYPLRVEIESERDTIVSWQRQIRQFTYVSGGLEARTIESASDEARETEDGDIRLID